MLDIVIHYVDGDQTDIIHVRESDWPRLRNILLTNGLIHFIDVRDSGLGVWSTVIQKEWNK